MSENDRKCQNSKYFETARPPEPPEAVGPVQSMWMCAVPAEATRECDLSAQSCTVTIVTVQTHQFVMLSQAI